MKRIVLTPELIAEAKAKMLQQFEDKMVNVRNGGSGTISLSFTPNEVELEEPIIINYTGKAYAKQLALVQGCNSEVAWHGVVETNAKRDYFKIVDILVYPQTVTGVTVTTDEVKYESWKNKLNDTQYRGLRFQAHSHVNMGATPSGTDRAMYNNFLQCLGKDSFYMFMIINKRNEMHIEIYDLQNNAIYTNNDIVVMCEEEVLSDWYDETMEANVAKQVYQATTYAHTTATGAAAPTARWPEQYNRQDEHGDFYGSYCDSMFDRQRPATTPKTPMFRELPDATKDRNKNKDRRGKK